MSCGGVIGQNTLKIAPEGRRHHTDSISKNYWNRIRYEKVGSKLRLQFFLEVHGTKRAATELIQWLGSDDEQCFFIYIGDVKTLHWNSSTGRPQCKDYAPM